MNEIYGEDDMLTETVWIMKTPLSSGLPLTKKKQEQIPLAWNSLNQCFINIDMKADPHGILGSCRCDRESSQGVRS